MKSKKTCDPNPKSSCQAPAGISRILVVAKKPMTMAQIQQKAVTLGLAPGEMKKEDLIRAIQSAEGNRPCFGTSHGGCPYIDCCFMPDCLKA